MTLTLDDLRRYAVARSLFPPTTLPRALEKFGFVQADPIRAPARAQDLTLRHRVKDYRAGDLERRYAKLGIYEDFFINYGFVTKELQSLMHPRFVAGPNSAGRRKDVWHSHRWPMKEEKQAALLLDFVRERGTVHPREVDSHFAHGNVKNYWGGSSNATTHLLDKMHYAGLLRVVRRDEGIRIYAAHQHEAVPTDPETRRARIDTMADIAVGIYAPLPARSLSIVLRRLRYAAPQWHGDLNDALRRAKERLAHVHIEGVDWYWPAKENPARSAADESVRLLTPFDPIVWDRDRFEKLWGWQYRFEGYTPIAKRVRGYYALPMLWRDRVIGWGNLSLVGGDLKSEFGYIESPPRDRGFKRELDAELARIRIFLGLESRS
jgi:uncharacterized protein